MVVRSDMAKDDAHALFDCIYSKKDDAHALFDCI